MSAGSGRFTIWTGIKYGNNSRGRAAFVLVLTACHGVGQPSAAAQNGVPIEWGFNFFIPQALPALVAFVAILDAGGTDYRFNTLNTTPDLDKPSHFSQQ